MEKEANTHKVEEEESTKRGNWSGKLDFILALVGGAVGLGNVWRFPFMAYKNGGGLFYIPYWTMLIFVGLPMVFLELSIGQFCSKGSAKCWRFARLFSGIGAAQCILTALVAIYYNMIIAWAMLYFCLSFTKIPTVPWEKCDREWASPYCMDYLNLNIKSAQECINMNHTADPDGVCTTSGGAVYAIWNQTEAELHGKRIIVPAEDYFNKVVLKRSKGIEVTGTPIWQLVLSLLVAWLFIFLCMIKGVKSVGKVVYFTSTFPYVILLILLINGAMLPGAYDGIKFYFSPDLSRLAEWTVWIDACTQVFFSISASWGGLITLSSYNRFNNNVLRDSIIVSVGDTLTSMFAGSVIFCYIGYLSKKIIVEIPSVFEGGPALAFQVFPYAVSQMAISPLWSALFFFMIVILGCDSEFVLIETIITTIMDNFPSTQQGKRKIAVLAGTCLSCFLLGLPMTCHGGFYWLTLLDTYVGGWALLLIACLECIAVAYVYGLKRFSRDIGVMLAGAEGNSRCWDKCSYWWFPMWGLFTPACILTVAIGSIVLWKPMKNYPPWSQHIGWAIGIVTMLVTISIAIYQVIRAPGNTLSKKFKSVTKPTTDWGPVLESNRRKVAEYVPNFVISLHTTEDIEREDFTKL